MREKREPEKEPWNLSAKTPMLTTPTKERQTALSPDDGVSVGGGAGGGPDCGVRFSGATQNEGLEEHTTTKPACMEGLGCKAELDAVKERLRSVEKQLRCGRK